MKQTLICEKGACVKYTVTLAGCVSEPNPMEQMAGVHLFCQAVLLGDTEVWLEKARVIATRSSYVNKAICSRNKMKRYGST